MAVEGATPAERLAKQRRSLRKRLGMGGKLDELMETDKLIKDEDLLLAEGPTAASKKGKDSTEAAELLTNMEGAASCCLTMQLERAVLSIRSQLCDAEHAAKQCRISHHRLCCTVRRAAQL